MSDLVTLGPSGAECPAANVSIDPAVPVARAVITHAHADHARPGSGEYWCAAEGAALARRRLGADAKIHGIPYGEAFDLNGVRATFFPSGHILGAAQVRLEAGGENWVIAGDYKRDPDPTCAPFEVVPCDVFVTEATFGLPIYRWPNPDTVIADIANWWAENAAQGKISVLLAYALGKAQRILAGLQAHTDGVVHVHGAVEPLVQIYREAGVSMLPTESATAWDKKTSKTPPLVIAPPGWESTPWMRRFGADAQVGFASGWMRVRGNRRRKAMDRGFVLSDHADWQGLLRTLREVNPQRVLVTHGSVAPMVGWLREQGVNAESFETGWTVEERPVEKPVENE